jgi:YD repeat-containing protein
VSRVTTTDGLGRIIQVTEKGIGTGGADANTYYTYDGLDNLIGLNQSGQIRSFTYDSLGRLTQAVNGESGTTCYSYDNDGNLSTRIQAANSTCTAGVGITTSYTYDYLNRLTSKVMPEGSVTYTYDQGTNGLGHLYSVSYGNATTTYNVHDQLGRVTTHNANRRRCPLRFQLLLQRIQQPDGHHLSVRTAGSRHLRYGRARGPSGHQRRRQRGLRPVCRTRRSSELSAGQRAARDNELQ